MAVERQVWVETSVPPILGKKKSRNKSQFYEGVDWLFFLAWSVLVVAMGTPTVEGLLQSKERAMIELTEKPIDPAAVYERLSRESAGSVLLHVGVVKPVAQGKSTKGIRFTPQKGLEEEIQTIESAIREEWDLADVLLVRRVGTLSIGEIILVAAISAADRESAFGACREAVERFKKLKKVKKEELFEERVG